jgi:hypothetical protein
MLVMAEEFQFRRLPAVEKKISGINPEKDVRVRILGRVIDSSDSTLVIDDGSAKAEVVLDSESGVVMNQLVRVFCRVLPLETGFELRGEIVQDMNRLDINAYRKAIGF